MRYFIPLFMLIFFSCKEEIKPVTNPVETFDNTPSEVIIDKVDFNKSSYTKRRRDGLVIHLYNEAMEQDQNLKNLDQKIDQIAEDNVKTLEKYNDYLKYNSQYYQAAKLHLSSIGDTVKRNQVKSMLAQSESSYESKITDIKAIDMEIYTLAKTLNDNRHIMKILISEDIISAYQQNKPDVTEMKKLITKYEELIKVSEAYGLKK